MPETASVVVPEVELAKEMVPDAAPLACGVNVTLNATLLPAAMVAGNEIPLRPNSVLLRVADVTVTLAPAALRVAGVVEVAPTATFPKLRVAGLTLSWPAAVPVPERATLRLEEAKVKESVPLALPVAVGA